MTLNFVICSGKKVAPDLIDLLVCIYRGSMLDLLHLSSDFSTYNGLPTENGTLETTVQNFYSPFSYDHDFL